MTNQRIYGLIGKNIDYSFSVKYFSEKFVNQSINNAVYRNFDLQDITEVKAVFAQNHHGYNVTIPYKKQIIPYLHQLSPEAAQIGAVNVIQKLANGQLIGHNTDWLGFYHSLQPLLQKHHQKALVLGTGGASDAVCFALKKLNIDYKKVSRKVENDFFVYNDLNANVLDEYKILVNCTPLGTYPKVDVKPILPYDTVSAQHLLYDLIYNPAETQFLLEGKNRGANIKNGYEMLVRQAEASWDIWQNS